MKKIENKKKFWKNILIDIVENVDSHQDVVVKKEKEFIIIKDKFPKSKYHFLVIPHQDINSVTDIKHAHLPLLIKMKEAAVELSKEFDTEFETKYGFHLLPSLNRLHLHVITQDFESNSLTRNKRKFFFFLIFFFFFLIFLLIDWFSFTTKLFVEIDFVIQQLTDNKELVFYGEEEMKELENGKEFLCNR